MIRANVTKFGQNYIAPRKFYFDWYAFGAGFKQNQLLNAVLKLKSLAIPVVNNKKLSQRNSTFPKQYNGIVLVQVFTSSRQ